MTQAPADPGKTKPRRPSAALRAALWMVLSSAAFAGMTATIRQTSPDLHSFEIAFFRCLFGLLFMMPWLARAGIGALRTQRLPLYALRAVIGYFAFAEVPDLWTWIGAGIIAASSLYIARRETVAAKESARDSVVTVAPGDGSDAAPLGRRPGRQPYDGTP